jgi:hypothetical protein
VLGTSLKDVVVIAVAVAVKWWVGRCTMNLGQEVLMIGTIDYVRHRLLQIRRPAANPRTPGVLRI